jgi:AcrR family transcriptional regulator
MYKSRKRKANAMTRNPNMREAILSAAELLFSTRGFNAVSIRDIALEAGANPGSITYHFKSKDGLCAAGIFIQQRPRRRRGAVHAAARGDVGRR